MTIGKAFYEAPEGGLRSPHFGPDARVTASYGRVARGVQVPVMSTVAIMREGRRLVDAGADDATLDAGVKAAVDRVRVN